MKKAIYITIIICILVLGIVLFIPKTNMSFAERGNIVYVTDRQCIKVALTTEDFNIILNLFDRKILYHDNPSCGFSENIAISMNSGQNTFCVARDGCPIIYWKNQEMYFRLTEEDYEVLIDLLEKYGFIIPCV